MTTSQSAEVLSYIGLHDGHHAPLFIEKRIQFKIFLLWWELTGRHHTDIHQGNLYSSPDSLSQPLCSAVCGDMQVPSIHTSTWAHHAFLCLGPFSCNSPLLHNRAVAFNYAEYTFSNYLTMMSFRSVTTKCSTFVRHLKCAILSILIHTSIQD